MRTPASPPTSNGLDRKKRCMMRWVEALVPVVNVLCGGARQRTVWEAICAITHEETGGRLSEPSPYEAAGDVDWMVIVGVDALSHGDDPRLAMIDAADPLRGRLYKLHIDQIERRAAIIEATFAQHFPRHPAARARRG